MWDMAPGSKLGSKSTTQPGSACSASDGLRASPAGTSRSTGRSGWRRLPGAVEPRRQPRSTARSSSCSASSTTGRLRPERRLCPVCGMVMWPRTVPKPLRFHDLRHTTATLVLRAGVDPHRVQRILRHRDLRTTLGTYGHLDVGDLRSAVAALPANVAVSAPGLTDAAPRHFRRFATWLLPIHGQQKNRKAGTTKSLGVSGPYGRKGDVNPRPSPWQILEALCTALHQQIRTRSL